MILGIYGVHSRIPVESFAPRNRAALNDFYENHTTQLATILSPGFGSACSALSQSTAIGSVVAQAISRNFHFELPLHPKTYASCPVVSTANSSGLFEVVVRHILAVLRSRCAGFACPACLAAGTYPARPLLST